MSTTIDTPIYYFKMQPVKKKDTCVSDFWKDQAEDSKPITSAVGVKYDLKLSVKRLPKTETGYIVIFRRFSTRKALSSTYPVESGTAKPQDNINSTTTDLGDRIHDAGEGKRFCEPMAICFDSSTGEGILCSQVRLGIGIVCTILRKAFYDWYQKKHANKHRNKNLIDFYFYVQKKEYEAYKDDIEAVEQVNLKYATPDKTKGLMEIELSEARLVCMPSGPVEVVKTFVQNKWEFVNRLIFKDPDGVTQDIVKNSTVKILGKVVDLKEIVVDVTNGNESALLLLETTLDAAKKTWSMQLHTDYCKLAKYTKTDEETNDDENKE